MVGSVRQPPDGRQQQAGAMAGRGAEGHKDHEAVLAEGSGFVILVLFVVPVVSCHHKDHEVAVVRPTVPEAAAFPTVCRSAGPESVVAIGAERPTTAAPDSS